MSSDTSPGPQETSRIPIVILTAIGHELNKKFAQEMGADGYVTKPFTREALLEETRRLMVSPAVQCADGRLTG